MTEYKLSAGHRQNPNSGADGIINEVVEARKVVEGISKYMTLLKAAHRRIFDNTTTNQQDNLAWLTKEHNKTKGENYLVHFNAATKTKEDRGVEVYYHAGNEADRKKAQEISDAISKVSGLKNRGAKPRNDLYVVNGTKERCLLIEVCFVDSEADVKKYRDSFDAICQVIAETIVGRKYVKPTPTTPEPVKPTTQKLYRVCVGSYVNHKNAEEMQKALKKSGYDSFIVLN